MGFLVAFVEHGGLHAIGGVSALIAEALKIWREGKGHPADEPKVRINGRTEQPNELDAAMQKALSEPAASSQQDPTDPEKPPDVETPNSHPDTSSEKK